MELIDRNKIEFSPIRILDFDENKHKVTGMALFKDIEKIPTVKAIPLDKVKKAREIIEDRSTYDGIYIDRADVLEILDKLIESEE